MGRGGRNVALYGLAILAASLALATRPGLAADPPASEVPAELWDRPRSGRIVLALPAVRQAIGALNAKPETRLAIRHPPGAESVLQAEELKAWLVAHAIEPARIVLRQDSAVKHAMQLELLPGAGR